MTIAALSVDQLVGDVRTVLSVVAPVERVEVVGRILDGYCPACGESTGGLICLCEQTVADQLPG